MFLLTVYGDTRADVYVVLVGEGNIFCERFNFGYNSVNAMQRCFELILIHQTKKEMPLIS